jgi:hypothetical protein
VEEEEEEEEEGSFSLSLFLLCKVKQQQQQPGKNTERLLCSSVDFLRRQNEDGAAARV